MHKRCLYGCSTLSFCFVLRIYPLPLYFAKSCEIEESFIYIIQVLVHQPSTSYLGPEAGELPLEEEEFSTVYENIIYYYSKKTGQLCKIIEEDMQKNENYMTGDEAKVYGLVDVITTFIGNNHKYITGTAHHFRGFTEPIKNDWIDIDF